MLRLARKRLRLKAPLVIIGAREEMAAKNKSVTSFFLSSMTPRLLAAANSAARIMWAWRVTSDSAVAACGGALKRKKRHGGVLLMALATPKALLAS